MGPPGSCCTLLEMVLVCTGTPPAGGRFGCASSTIGVHLAADIARKRTAFAKHAAAVAAGRPGPAAGGVCKRSGTCSSAAKSQGYAAGACEVRCVCAGRRLPNAALRSRRLRLVEALGICSA